MAASVTPSRTSGVAPLAVLFDCSGSTTAETSTPFHDAEYIHEFGDTTDYRWQATDGSGAWGNSWGDSWWDSWGLDAQNKNVARGPIAVHVYETASTFIHQMTFIDGAGASRVTTAITVSDPAVVYAGVSTICISASSVPVAGSGGAPAGCSTAQVSSWPDIMNVHALDGRRVLLNRGEIYTGTATAVLDNSIVTVGAYGTGAKPIIRTVSTVNNSDILRIGDADVTDDCRFMDLVFDGETDIHRNCFRGSGTFTLDRLLLLRCDLKDAGAGFVISNGASLAIPNGIYFVDSTVKNINTSSGTAAAEGCFFDGENLGVLGAHLEDTDGGVAEHLLRISACNKGVFSHNVLKHSAQNKEMFALRGANVSGTGPYPASYPTQYCVLSKNQIETNTYAGIQVDTEASSFLGEVQDIILDSNYFRRTSSGIGDFRIRATRVTARNNISEMSRSASGILPFDVRGSGSLSSITADVWIYNNSVYSSTSTGSARLVSLVDINISGLIIRNNILYAPNNGGTPVEVFDSGTGNSFVTTNNLVTKSSDPLFLVDPPIIPSQFALTSSSPAISTGLVTTVFYDFFESYRSRATFDIGAFAWNTSTAPTPQDLVVRTLFMYPKLDGIGSGGIFIGDSVR